MKRAIVAAALLAACGGTSDPGAQIAQGATVAWAANPYTTTFGVGGESLRADIVPGTSWGYITFRVISGPADVWPKRSDPILQSNYCRGSGCSLALEFACTGTGPAVVQTEVTSSDTPPVLADVGPRLTINCT